MESKKINFITLGCAKNTVDSEHVMAQFREAGYEPVFDSDDRDARIVVINTCGFIADAKEESIETILHFAGARKAGRIDRLYVIGCLSERYAHALRKEIPEVDQYFGVRDLSEILREVARRDWNAACATDRLLTTPPHYAYLKISEGCDHRCAYCVIPLIRGPHRSVPMETLLAEARKLAGSGVKELIVIAQDTTWYGLDLYGERKLGTLLRALCRIDGIEWVRLHYTHPAHFPDDVIEVLAREAKMCKYLDIPLQHISDNQLKAMRRGISGSDTRALIRRLREEVPGIAIRTTLLVGFPGETQADVEELAQFVRESRFERLGVFTYSEEEGTCSAENLSDETPQAEKMRRAEGIMAIQNNISHENNLSLIGKTVRIVIDRTEGAYFIGRSSHDSPEVDQEILVRSTAPLVPGEFYHVQITGAEHYDLYAEVVDS